MKEKITSKPVDNAIHDFMSVTGKNSVAVIVPLYGYWSDIKNNPLIEEEVLSYVMKRIESTTHQLYIIFVGHPQSIPSDAKNPHSVANVLLSMSQAGNVISLPIDRHALYSEYIKMGMDYVLNETQSQFVVVFNPWVLIQENSIDILVDRANRADQAKVISGFDFRELVEVEAFDDAKINIPSEEWDLSLDFMAMPRFMAEMTKIDENYQTHKYLERDLWQQVFNMGYGVITSQRVPIFPFDFPWENYETKEQKQLDRDYFGKKWGFTVEPYNN